MLTTNSVSFPNVLKAKNEKMKICCIMIIINFTNSCNYPILYYNLEFHVLHFHVIRMKNKIVKNFFSRTTSEKK